jgi:nuclear protein NHN1
MFDMVRPMAYPPHASTPHEYRPHIDRSNMVRSLSNYTPAHAPKVEEVPTESAWERGLRHAKEVRYLQSMAMYHMCNTYKMNS